jgi:hypothetical protein
MKIKTHIRPIVVAALYKNAVHKIGSESYSFKFEEMDSIRIK